MKIVKKVKKIIFKIKLFLGFDLRLTGEDRRVMEGVIIPFFTHLTGQPGFSRILFVGCDWYTRPYRRLFAGREYWTIDIDPTKRKYGSKRHIVDSLTHLDRHFGPETFDLILCNGVFGWGLNDPGEVETAFSHCTRCLRPGGIFILGWNDIPERKPFPPQECPALNRLEPFIFPPLQTAQFLTQTPNRHTFNFYRKP